MAKKQIIIILKKYISILKQEGINIDKAFLYGSYAKETETKESDIDLLIVSKQFDKNDDYLIGKIWALTKKINSKIEPYIIGLDRFKTDDTSPLIQLVKKEGLEIA
jgi:predicted nucleotidyltransferase